MNIDKIAKTVLEFPTDSEFFTIHEGQYNKWVESHFVHSYKVVNDEIFLVEVIDGEFIDNFSISECFKSKEEAKKLIPPMNIKTRVAVDEFGREIDFAIFDGDKVEDVSVNYKVHVEHCCVIHGCKYGDNDCPVINAQMLQKHLCEKCTEVDVHWNDLIQAYKHRKVLEIYDT